MASASSSASWSPQPETSACIRAPPISSRLTRSPTTISAIRGEPRYIDAFASTMITRSQKDGMYAPPAALGPNRQQICGTRPDSATWLWKIRPAPRRPGNRSTWSVIRAPAESMNQKIGSSSRSAISVIRMIFSTVRAPHEPAFTLGSLATTSAGRPSTRPRPVTTPSAGSRLGAGRWPAVRPRRSVPVVEQQRDPVPDVELALARQAWPRRARRERQGGRPSRAPRDRSRRSPSPYSTGSPSRGRSAAAAPPRSLRRSPASWRRGRTGPPGTPP